MTSKHQTIENTLDLSGLACPMPIIKLKKYLAQNADNLQPFNLMVTDEGALKDIPAFCQQQGLDCELIHDKRDDYKYIYFLIYVD